MTALRETYGSGGHGRDEVREAHMRLRIRDAQREFGGGVAVVCGAWHVPALRRRTGVTADRALLKGLPKVKTDVTWVPWTHRRLSRAGGYGAGIASPGWYAHLFAAPDRPVERWLTKVAGLLRAEDRPVSPGHVIEAVRLAETLAALRGRPLPGLGEATDAVRAVMCDGSDVPLALVRDRLVVGDVLGEVPDTVPAVPLQRDLERTRRGCGSDPRRTSGSWTSTCARRPARSAAAAAPAAAARHRLGTPGRPALRHRHLPRDLAAALGARTGRAHRRGGGVGDDRAGRRDRQGGGGRDRRARPRRRHRSRGALPAGRPARRPAGGDARPRRPCRPRHRRRPPRAGAARPGPLAALRRRPWHRHGRPRRGRRGSRRAGLRRTAPACAGLDADAAEEMRSHVDAVHGALGLLGDIPAARGGRLRARWRAVLRTLSARDTVPGVLRGRAVRLLLDEGELPQDEAARLMGLVLSPGTPRRTRPRGSRGSSAAPAAGCCWCTTSGCSAWSTGG